MVIKIAMLRKRQPAYMKFTLRRKICCDFQMISFSKFS